MARRTNENTSATTRTSGSQPPPTARIDEARIRTRAYEIFLARQGAPGNPLTDWLQAERELRMETGSHGSTGGPRRTMTRR